MKNLFTTLAIGLSLLLPSIIVPEIGNAATSPDLSGTCSSIPAGQPQPEICKETAPSTENPLYGPEGIITRVVNILSIVLGVIAVFVIIIFGGIRMITSSGDPAKISSARQAIVFAAVGLAIAAFAQFLVAFVLKRIGI